MYTPTSYCFCQPRLLDWVSSNRLNDLIPLMPSDGSRQAQIIPVESADF